MSWRLLHVTRYGSIKIHVRGSRYLFFQLYNAKTNRWVARFAHVAQKSKDVRELARVDRVNDKDGADRLLDLLVQREMV